MTFIERTFSGIPSFNQAFLIKLKNTFYVSPEDDVKRGEHKSFDRHLTVGKQNPGQQLIPISRERLTNTLQHTLQRSVEPFQTSVALRMVGRCLDLDNLALKQTQLG